MANKQTNKTKKIPTLSVSSSDLRSAIKNGSMDLGFKEQLGREQLLKTDLNALYEKYDAEKNLIKKRRPIGF